MTVVSTSRNSKTVHKAAQHGKSVQVVRTLTVEERIQRDYETAMKNGNVVVLEDEDGEKENVDDDDDSVVVVHVKYAAQSSHSKTENVRKSKRRQKQRGNKPSKQNKKKEELHVRDTARTVFAAGTMQGIGGLNGSGSFVPQPFNQLSNQPQTWNQSYWPNNNLLTYYSFPTNLNQQIPQYSYMGGIYNPYETFYWRQLFHSQMTLNASQRVQMLPGLGAYGMTTPQSYGWSAPMLPISHPTNVPHHQQPTFQTNDTYQVPL